MSIDYAISESDYSTFLNGKASRRLELIWSDILMQIEDKNLRKEAKEKGFTLVPSDHIREDTISKMFSIQIPDGSSELKKTIKKLHHLVSLIKD